MVDPSFSDFINFDKNPALYKGVMALMGGALAWQAYDLFRVLRPSQKTIDTALAQFRDVRSDGTSTLADRYLRLTAIPNLPANSPEVEEFRGGLEVEIGRVVETEVQDAIRQGNLIPDGDLRKLSPTFVYLSDQINLRLLLLG